MCDVFTWNLILLLKHGISRLAKNRFYFKNEGNDCYAMCMRYV